MKEEGRVLKFLIFLAALAQALACDFVSVPACEVASHVDQVFIGTTIEVHAIADPPDRSYGPVA